MFDVTYAGINVIPSTTSNIDVPFVELSSTAGTVAIGIPLVTVSSDNGVLGETVVSNVISVPNLTANTTITVTPTNNYSSVKSIEIAGVKYVAATSSTSLVPGSYYYDNITNTLTVQTSATVPALNQILVVGGMPTTITDSIDVPSFILDYNLSGTVSITRGFEQHPTISFSLICNKAQINNIRYLFSDYYQKYVFYGMVFRCNTRATKIRPLKKYPIGYYEVSLSFQGYFQELLGRQVFVKQSGGSSASTSTPYADSSCKLNATSNNSTVGTSATNPNNATISLSEIASKAGFSYSGYQFQYEYPKDSPPDTTVSFSNALGDKPITKGLYICYSQGDSVTTIPWSGVPTYTNSDEFILSESLDEQKNLKPVEYDTVELSWDMQNTTQDSTNNSEDNKNNKEPEFEHKTPQKNVVKGGDDNPTKPPSSDKTIKTLDLCFDKSGPRKTYTETTYLGSSVVAQTVQIYGYMYNASDIYNASTKQFVGNPASFWKLIEETTTTYLIDPPTGYNLGTDITGWRYGRYKQETDALETATFTDASQIVPYKFIKIPITGATRYLLLQYRDIYLDSQNVYPYITYQSCDPRTGQVQYNAKLDPSWVEPMFVAQEMNETYSFNSMPDPANANRSADDPIKPPLTVGEQKLVRSRTKIYRSKNTTVLVGMTTNGNLLSDIFIGDTFTLSDEDKYTKFSSNFSAQDSGFSNSLEETKEEDSTGKPPQASKQPSSYVRVDGQAQLSETKKPDTTKPAEPSYKYILTTPPHSPYAPIQSSISFSAKTQADALQAARTKIEIDDMQQNTQTSIDILFNPYIVEGYRYYPSYASETYAMRVTNNNSVISIKGKDLFGETKVSGKTTLSLGTDSHLGNSVALTKIPQPTPPGDSGNTATNGGLVSFQYIWHQGFELGNLVSLNAKTRTNF